MKSQIHASQVEGSPAEEGLESKEFEQHEIEAAAGHLTKAEEVKKNSKLMKHVAAHLAMQQQNIHSAIKGTKKFTSLDDLKKHAYDTIKNEDKSAKEA